MKGHEGLGLVARLRRVSRLALVPRVFFFLGITPPEQAGKAPANHSPLFFVDEKALPVGVRALANLAVDYLTGAGR